MRAAPVAEPAERRAGVAKRRTQRRLHRVGRHMVEPLREQVDAVSHGPEHRAGRPRHEPPDQPRGDEFEGQSAGRAGLISPVPAGKSGEDRAALGRRQEAGAEPVAQPRRARHRDIALQRGQIGKPDAPARPEQLASRSARSGGANSQPIGTSRIGGRSFAETTNPSGGSRCSGKSAAVASSAQAAEAAGATPNRRADRGRGAAARPPQTRPICPAGRPCAVA